MIGLIFIVLLRITEIQAQCCPAGGIWSEWVADLSTCYDYCGGAGNMTRNRTCLSIIGNSNCPCVGNTSELVSCDTYPCIYPRNFSCFMGKTLQVVGSAFQCMPPNTTTTTITTNISAPACDSCPTQGIWGEWVNSGTCSDTCGGCGLINRTRTCLSTPYGCKCLGNIWELQFCNTVPCVNRTAACCLAFNQTIVNGTTTCVPLYSPVPVNQTTSCLNANGLWNQWSSWSTCSGTCGMCGIKTRTRTCGSAPYGCPCTGNSTDAVACGGNACPGGLCCGTSVLATSYDGANICLPVKPAAVSSPGTWTSWSSVIGRTCNDTCGAWGSVASYRFCLPLGTSCSGSFFGLTACPSNVCVAPRQSCAPGFIKTVNTTLNTFQCTSQSPPS